MGKKYLDIYKLNRNICHSSKFHAHVSLKCSCLKEKHQGQKQAVAVISPLRLMWVQPPVLIIFGFSFFY